MPTLLLRFAVNLENYADEAALRHHGPLFHRWLPDGQKDAIGLEAKDPNVILTVWFERRGFVQGSFVEFDHKRKEVDPAIMNQQGVLDAGPLWGQLEIRGLSDQEVEPVRSNLMGDPAYIALGRRAVIDLAYPLVAKFLGVLRLKFGQYWIKELEPWDSRSSSLGGYCHHLHLEWSLDNGANWAPFLPDDPMHYVSMTVTMGGGFLDYLSEDDWRQLPETIRVEPEPTAAAVILGRTHELLNRGDIRYAAIEGVTALEFALKQFMRTRLAGQSRLQTQVQSFWNLPLSTQAITLAAAMTGVSPEDIERTVQVVDIRNRIVHEGKTPPEDVRQQLQGLMRTTAALIGATDARFPSGNHSNQSASPDQWLEQYKKAGRPG